MRSKDYATWAGAAAAGPAVLYLYGASFGLFRLSYTGRSMGQVSLRVNHDEVGHFGAGVGAGGDVRVDARAIGKMSKGEGFICLGSSGAIGQGTVCRRAAPLVALVICQ